MSNISKLKVTSKDYASIYQELVSTIPEVSKIWNSSTETDPGIVLIKLMSMFGDMLSYNLDKAVQEIYPDTVTQRKNAAQIFSLMGYKMRWYRSAQCTAYITNNGPSSVSIPRYSKFITKGDEIPYTNLSQVEVGSGQEQELLLYQGLPRIPSKIENKLIATGNNPWHSIYNFNITKDNIVDNRIYVEDNSIDESSIILIDNLGDTWTQTESISTETSTGKYYELKIDNNDRPYIKLISYWNTFSNVEKFKLFYLISDGEEGQIAANTMNRIQSNILIDGEESDSSYLAISNSDSIYGYDPETPDEARDESSKYINTFNTLITLDDFKRAVRRLNGVANCYVTDITTDPYTTAGTQYTPLVKYEVKLYITRTDSYRDVEKSIYINYILNEISSNKIYPLTLRIVVDEQEDEEYEPATVYYDWTVSGTVYLSEPVSMDRSKEILVKINNNLKNVYDMKNIEYNDVLKYTDVVNSIIKSDSIISYVDLNPVEYYENIYDEDSEPISNPKETISGKYTKSVLSYENGLPLYDDEHPESDGVELWLDENERYYINLSNTPIKPGSICIRLENNEYIIVDDKNGKLICNNSFLNQGTINYSTGIMTMTLNGKIYANFTVSYMKNKICIVRFAELNTEKLIIDADSIKQ